MAKANLGLKISRIIKEQKLTQARAAKLMGLTQPDVFDLIWGRLDGFTPARLFHYLGSLGQEAELMVRPERMPVDIDQRRHGSF